MNKELEALERLFNTCLNSDKCIPLDTTNDRNTIEKALKRLEEQDGVIKILKGVIKFSHDLPHIQPNKDDGFDIMSAVRINIQRDIENNERELLRNWVLKECFPKELKALEIIKRLLNEDCVSDLLHILHAYNKWEDYDYACDYNDENPILKSKEEFDILKEVLL